MNFFTILQVGMKIECADLMDPKLVCVATVSRIVGRLMRINFDGWEDVYDQWLDIESPDMYPVGWCFLVKHRLEGPKVAEKPQPPAKGPTKKRARKKPAVKGEGMGLGRGKGGGRGRMKQIKAEPMDEEQQQQQQKAKQQHQQAKKEAELLGTEELELLKESRRLGTMDLEEDSSSRLMGSSGLAEDGHGDEYTLSVVGGEDLMMMAGEEDEEHEEEEDEDEEDNVMNAELSRIAEKVMEDVERATNVSSSSSSAAGKGRSEKVRGI